MKSVKVALMKRPQRGGGYSDMSFTPEEAKSIQAAARQDVLKGRRQREAYESLGLSQPDVQLGNEIGLDKGEAVLLGQIKHVQKGLKDQFSFIKDHALLDKLLQSVPDLDVYSPKVLKMVVDNKRARLNDEEERQFYELSDIILNDPQLSSLFQPDDILNEYNDMADAQNLFADIQNGQQDFLQNQQRLMKGENQLFEKMDSLLTTDGKDMKQRAADFKQFKQNVPSFQKAYNVKQGNNPNQNIVQLGKDKVDEIFPLNKRAEDIKVARQLNVEADKLEKTLADWKDENDNDIEAYHTGYTVSVEELAAATDPEYKEMYQKLVDEYGAVIAQYEKDVNTVKEMRAEAQQLLGEGMHGEGLVRDPGAPFGRFKNGKPRKTPQKGAGAYEPRNKKHWIQKRVRNEQGKVVFAGGTLSYPEMIRKLLEVRDSGQPLKAIQMLDALQDVLPMKEYQRAYKLITS